MPVVTRVTGCVVCAVLVARGPYEGTVLTAIIRVVAVSRSRGFVNGIPPTALIVVPTIRSAVRAGPVCESRTRATRESCPGLGASRPGGASLSRPRTTRARSRSPCYSCALWWAASAHYSIPTLRRRRAETHPFPSFQFERVGSNIERHPNLISNTHQPSTRQASHQAPWSRLNVCASHCVRRSAD